MPVPKRAVEAAEEQKKGLFAIERHAEVARAQPQLLEVYNQVLCNHAGQLIALLRRNDGYIAYEHRLLLIFFLKSCGIEYMAFLDAVTNMRRTPFAPG